MKGSRSESTGPNADADQDADESSSSYDQYSTTSNNPSGSGEQHLFKSTPGTPRRKTGRLRNTKSTPQLRLHDDAVPPNRLFVTEQDSIRIKQMKGLMKKLDQAFPEDIPLLKEVHLGALDPTETIFTTKHYPCRNDVAEDAMGVFVDTRGPPPQPENERIIHVFVDQ